MANSLGVVVDNLVSREYLDMRLAELEARLESRMDARFAQQDTRIEAKLSPIHTRLARHELMLAAIFIAVVVPLVRDFVV